MENENEKTRTIPKRFFSVKELSELLQVSPLTVTRYINDGDLQAHKVGKAWRVSEDELKVYLEKTST